MKTPEGYLKDLIKKELKKIPGCFYYMPVPGGYGMTTVDFLCCINGRFVAIETKAPGKKPTARQDLFLTNINNTGGVGFSCDSLAVFWFEMGRHGLR